MAAIAGAAGPPMTGRFHLRMALVCALIAFLGFTPSYWAPLAAGTLSEAPIVHLHGLLFSAWSLFFVAQTALVVNGRPAQHRAAGLIGIALASAMLFAGLAAAIHSTGAQVDAGAGERARGFMIIPVTTLLFFAVGVTVAIANRGRPEVHKRWMLVATIAILMAAVARIVRFVRFGTEVPPGPPPVEGSLVPAFGTDLLIVAAIIYDWRTRGRVHPAYWVAGGLWLAIQLGRIPLSKSPQWHAVADWLLSFAA